MFGKASVLLVLGLSLGGCSETTTVKSQGQTHWLVQCDSDTDCGELSCECGVCTARCGSGECTVEGVEAQCCASDSVSVRELCGEAHDAPLCLEPGSDGAPGPDASAGEASASGPDASSGEASASGPDASSGESWASGPDASSGEGWVAGSDASTAEGVAAGPDATVGADR